MTTYRRFSVDTDGYDVWIFAPNINVTAGASNEDELYELGEQAKRDLDKAVEAGQKQIRKQREKLRKDGRFGRRRGDRA